MPDFGSATFSQTDSSNASGTMPSWSGSAAPSTLDDAGRALQGAVTREWNWRNYTVTATGTSDAKVLTYSVAPAAYYNGQRFSFIANTTTTSTTPTLSVNGLTATTIKKISAGTISNLAVGEMVAGMFVEVAYNTANTCFVWVNSVAPFITDASGNVGIGAAPTYKLDVNQATRVAARFGPTTGGAVILSTTANQGLWGAGWDFNGTNFVARDALASYISTDGGTVSFTQNTGLTPGNTFTPTTRMYLDTNGAWLQLSGAGIGYGTGSGGGVTQLTSKTTSVTVNKTNGYILTSNSALNGGASATFTVSNSTFAASDNVVLNSTNGNYSARVANNNNGSFTITLKNETGGSLSDAVQIQFAIIKSVFA